MADRRGGDRRQKSTTAANTRSRANDRRITPGGTKRWRAKRSDAKNSRAPKTARELSRGVSRRLWPRVLHAAQDL